MSSPVCDCVGIVGNGVVGNATLRTWVEWCKFMYVYDSVQERRQHSFAEVLDNSRVVFVCLPTPFKNGECDTSALDEFFERAHLRGAVGGKVQDRDHQLLVIRSTVPIGYTRHTQIKYRNLRICHSPEFLTARCAVLDAANPSRNIVGEVGHMSAWRLYDMYQWRFPGTQLIRCTSDASETAKLATNSFFSVKIAFFNELNQLCARKQVDWPAVLACMLSDGRINPSHTTVPGPDGKFGFGGACLPKDLAALIEIADRVSVSTPVMDAARDRNDYDRLRKS